MSKTPKTLTADEQSALLGQLSKLHYTQKQHLNSLRNYTMALLMLHAGLRVGEVVKLRIDDLYRHHRPVISIIVRAEIAKNHKERIIPTSKGISDAIESMLETVWNGWQHGEFVYAFGRYPLLEPMSTRQVERIIKAAALKAIGRAVHPHVLRHTFATRVMKVAGIRVTQELLGHASITSTQIYTHPDAEDKKNAIENMENGDQK